MQDRAPAEGRAQTCIPYPHFKSYVLLRNGCRIQDAYPVCGFFEA